MAATAKVKLISNCILNFRQCTRYRQRHTATVITTEKLKSIDNSGNYSRSTSIATAIRNSRSSPTTSDGRINQPTTMEADNQRWSPTTNDQHASTINDVRQYASRLAYVLSVASLSHSRWRTKSTIKQQSTNKIIYPEIKDRKPIATIGKEKVAVLLIPGRV